MTYEYKHQPCKAEGCERNQQTCRCSSCMEPWLYEYCSEECWESIPIAKRLEDENDWLCGVAAKHVHGLEKEIEDLKKVLDIPR